ncbi:MAG: 3-oxoacid CoA-transferase [Deltaproteobacteria bacterium]|jgi:propionate CoA-transferase|nr:3-oxoacid CoA-transferase [Deltaproteobacteria bacterium]
MSKIITAKQAAEMVKDGMTLAVGGFVGFGVPEELLIGLKERFLETKTPRDLTLFHTAAVGDGKERGCNHIGHEGLIKKLYCAHIGLEPALNKLTTTNKIATYMVPQGVTAHLLRAIGGGKVGVLTHVGLKTFADPRIEGCKANDAARGSGEDIVELVTVCGKEQLLYKSFPINICFLKASIGDEDGNLALTREGAHADHLEMAAATRNSGGIVIAQVEKIVARNTIHAQEVKVHGFMVDYIVEGKPENNVQCWLWSGYRPECSGEVRVPVSAIAPEPLTPRKVIGRRGAFELKPNTLVNLGIGIPDSVAGVAGEEGLADKITLSIESGILGGVPLPSIGIGGSVNPVAMYKQPDIFDIYDGGGISLSCLGAAQIDPKGNVNVSKFGGRVVGPGGFVNISQNAKKVCFCGTFTAGKAEYEIKDGTLNILQDADGIKFVNTVEQITFSGEYAVATNQPILFITERAVFKLTPEGLMLIEIAPGVDLDKHILAKMEFKPLIAGDLKLMDARIFRDEPMGLKL